MNSPLFQRLIALALCLGMLSDNARAFPAAAPTRLRPHICSTAVQTQALTPLLAAARFIPAMYLKLIPLKQLRKIRDRQTFNLPTYFFTRDHYREPLADAASPLAAKDVFVIHHRFKPLFQIAMEFGYRNFKNEIPAWIDFHPSVKNLNKSDAFRSVRHAIESDVLNWLYSKYNLKRYPIRLRKHLSWPVGWVGLRVFRLGLHWIGRTLVLPGSMRNLSAVVKAVKRTEANGLRSTICFAGEQVATEEEALTATDEIIQALQGLRFRLPASGPKRHFAIKLSALVAQFDPSNKTHIALATERAKRIFEAAEGAGVELEIDGETYREREAQIEIYKNLTDRLAPHQQIGIAVQAYFKDSWGIIEELVLHEAARHDGPRTESSVIPIRLVKGAYYDQEKADGNPVWETQEEVDANFREITYRLMWLASRGKVYPMIASMNPREQAWAFTTAAKFNLKPTQWESQMLYGMQRHLLQEMRDRGQPVRLYLLFADHVITAAKYFIRRQSEIAGPNAISRRVYDIGVPIEELAHISPYPPYDPGGSYDSLYKDTQFLAGLGFFSLVGHSTGGSPTLGSVLASVLVIGIIGIGAYWINVGASKLLESSHRRQVALDLLREEGLEPPEPQPLVVRLWMTLRERWRGRDLPLPEPRTDEPRDLWLRRILPGEYDRQKLLVHFGLHSLSEINKNRSVPLFVTELKNSRVEVKPLTRADFEPAVQELRASRIEKAMSELNSLLKGAEVELQQTGSISDQRLTVLKQSFAAASAVYHVEPRAVSYGSAPEKASAIYFGSRAHFFKNRMTMFFSMAALEPGPELADNLADIRVFFDVAQTTVTLFLELPSIQLGTARNFRDVFDLDALEQARDTRKGFTLLPILPLITAFGLGLGGVPLLASSHGTSHFASIFKLVSASIVIVVWSVLALRTDSARPKMKAAA